MSEQINKESLSTELEALKAVYLSDLVIDSDTDEAKVTNVATTSVAIEGGDNPNKEETLNKRFHVNLLPSTADEKAEQFVAITVCFELTSKYPDEVPIISLKSPRGLSDEKFNKILKDLNELAEKKKGTNMLYELIDSVKETLTTFNFPSGKCMICLYEFAKDDVFTKTECFHHFHCRCLADYSNSQTGSKEPSETEQSNDQTGKIPCPVCREEFCLSELLKEPFDKYPLPVLSKKPIAQENDLVEEARQSQEKFADIFEKQQQKGGIIDQTKENEVLHISNSVESSSSQQDNEPVSSTSKSESNKVSPQKSKSIESGSESLNIQADVSSSIPSSSLNETRNDSKNQEKTTNQTAIATTSGTNNSSPVEVTSTTKGKENARPGPKRRGRRQRRRNRTKSREKTNAATSTETQTQSGDENQPRPQHNEVQRYNQQYSNNRNYRNYNNQHNQRYIQRNNRSPNMRGYNMNQDNRYRQNNYSYSNGFVKDRPGYYAPRIFRRYGRPKPEMHTDVAHETSNDSGVTSSQVVSKRTTRPNENLRSTSATGEGTRRPRRYSSDDGFHNGNVQQSQSNRIRYINYYRPPQNYNQRMYNDYNQMNRYYNYYDNYNRYYGGYYSSRNGYYNGNNNRGYSRRGRRGGGGGSNDNDEGGRRRNNTVQSQSSNKGIDQQPRRPVSPLAIVDSTTAAIS